MLGHPVKSVVELARMLSRTGETIEPGMVVLTGGITDAIHVYEGDRVYIEFDQMGELNILVRA